MGLYRKNNLLYPEETNNEGLRNRFFSIDPRNRIFPEKNKKNTVKWELFTTFFCMDPKGHFLIDNRKLFVTG